MFASGAHVSFSGEEDILAPNLFKRTGIRRSLRPRGTTQKARLPDGVRIYAISDIHGCSDLLQNAFALIDRDIERTRPHRPIHIFLGDYIDRGPDSRQTIELLLQRGHQHECVFLKGNHEAIIQEVLRNPSQMREWRQFGGMQTLTSYGLQPPSNPNRAEQNEMVESLRQAMPDSHKQFIDNLDLKFTCGDFFFSHAGIRPKVPLNKQRETDLLWIREEFLLSTENHGKMVVHGHTPVNGPEFHGNRINIDTGAYATGKLTVLMIQESELEIAQA